MPAEPYGAADTGPTTGPRPSSAERSGPAEGTTGWPGRYGARWARTATGPTPGPPPPWGMQKVLWRLRWLTSAPNLPGRATPTRALRLAPSRYTCPPASCTAAQMSPMAVLEHAVGRGVGDHQRRHVGGVGGELGPQVVEVDVAVVVACHDHDLHAGHGRGGGVGAVGRGRDEADVAAVVAAAAVVGPDGQQAGELALRPGVGLERHRVVAGDVGQPGLEVADQAAVALGVGRPARRGGCRRTRAR